MARPRLQARVLSIVARGSRTAPAVTVPDPWRAFDDAVEDLGELLQQLARHNFDLADASVQEFRRLAAKFLTEQLSPTRASQKGDAS